MGMGLCVAFIAFVRLPSLKVSTLLLTGLLIYDVFWVFFSSYIFNANVMVKVSLGDIFQSCFFSQGINIFFQFLGGNQTSRKPGRDGSEETAFRRRCERRSEIIITWKISISQHESCGTFFNVGTGRYSECSEKKIRPENFSFKLFLLDVISTAFRHPQL